MSLEGNELVKYGRNGSKLGEFNFPLVCMCDENNSFLIAEFWNHRLQLLHGARWHEIELQPLPSMPKGAVFDGHAIYVLGFNPSQILKYECVG